MRRVLLFFAGIVLGLVAEIILWQAVSLHSFEDGWHSAAFTSIVGMAVIIEGILCALVAAVCLGRAVSPLIVAPALHDPRWPEPMSAASGGGPVLPLWGILFLLAAPGPLGQAWNALEQLQVMETMPGEFGAELVADYRKHYWLGLTFGAIWLVLGGALVATPWMLESRIWHLAWPLSAAGFGIAAGGFVLSLLGALVCFANALAMEGASRDVNTVGFLGVLAGAVVALLGAALITRCQHFPGE